MAETADHQAIEFDMYLPTYPNYYFHNQAYCNVKTNICK